MKRKNNLRKSINESVKQFIMEFGSGNSEKAKENRKKMAMASKRAIDKGDDSVYHNSVRSITTGGGSKEDLADFNNNWEKLNSSFLSIKLTISFVNLPPCFIAPSGEK